VGARSGGAEHDTGFWVCTYHMPCKYRNVPAMVTLAALLGQRVQSIVQNEPLIIAGDFNFVPNSSPYMLITTGRCSRDSPDYPHVRKIEKGRHCKWLPRMSALRSAYVLANGREPEVTNHSATRQRDGTINKFTDCLDYIFVSSHWAARDCIRTMAREELKAVRSLPNAYEPSDHLMIGCCLRLKKLDKLA